jgi:hypothetical protein
LNFGSVIHNHVDRQWRRHVPAEPRVLEALQLVQRSEETALDGRLVALQLGQCVHAARSSYDGEPERGGRAFFAKGLEPLRLNAATS